MKLSVTTTKINSRRLARIAAVLVVALAAGHLLQSISAKRLARTAKTETHQPTQIVPLAAGDSAMASATIIGPAPKSDTVPLDAAALAQAPDVAPQPPVPAALAAPDPCPLSLELTDQAGAMVGVSLLAPCRANQRVVLRHAGLAFTGQTNAVGSLFLSLPALEQSAQVEVLFGDGAKTGATIEIPELAALRRFGVEWQADDSFQIHALEQGAAYGQAGDISAENPGQLPIEGIPARGGFLMVLGDATVESPLMAQIYTFPADAATHADVVVEAAVTDKTCGRELLGEALASDGGKVALTDLTVSMPDCAAVGDYLVLNNLVPDNKIAFDN